MLMPERPPSEPSTRGPHSGGHSPTTDHYRKDTAMSLITWEPLGELTQFRRNMDALFNSYFAPSAPLNGHAWNPTSSVDENDKAFTITVELPGVDEKDVSVQLLGGQLTITGKRSAAVKDKQRNETWSGEFTRTATLPENVDTAKIEASYAKGLLTVTLPKTPQVKPTLIPIKAG